MPHYNIIEPDKLTIESLDRISRDIASNQQVDDDVYMHKFEMLERFGASNVYMNRHERRAAKAKYKKLNKK